MKLREMLDKRATLAQQARALLDAAEKETRDLTAEEQQRWDTLMNEVTALSVRIEREQRMSAVDAELARSPREAVKIDPDQREGGSKRLEFISRGMRGVTSLEDARWKALAPFADETYRQVFAGYLRRGVIPGEWQERSAALQADSDAQGGYLVTPMQFVDALIKAIDDAVYIRQWATVFSVPNAESLGVPSLDADPADADWTSELATGSEDSSMAFGRRSLTPHPLAKRIKISNKLLVKVPDSEGLVRDRLGYKFGITFEKALLTGSGAGQPLGVFTASALGISTARDVSTDNTTTAVTFDGLINAKYALKGQYWPNARWLFHRDGLKQIAKLVDGNGNYIWRETVRADEPDRLLGLPTFMSEYAPNTFTTGLYVGIVGDFRNYWIADSMAMTLQRLIELYAETNQVGLIGRLESDGMPVLEEAFVRVKLA